VGGKTRDSYRIAGSSDKLLNLTFASPYCPCKHTLSAIYLLFHARCTRITRSILVFFELVRRHAVHLALVLGQIAKIVAASLHPLPK